MARIKTYAFLPLTALLLSAAFLLPACGPVEDTAALKALGERLCLEGRFEEAVPVLKSYLLKHPDDSGAHFYLGRAYLSMPSPWLMIAQGELDTALLFFNQNAKKSTIERFSDVYFEQICYLESAKVNLQQILILQQIGAPVQEIEPYLNRVAELNDNARALDPALPDVGVLDTHIQMMREMVEQAKQMQPQTPPQQQGPRRRLPMPRTSSPSLGTAV